MPFAHKRVRRFFSLYFIPIIPLDVVGEYIECARCRGTYDLAVLRYDPGAAVDKVEAQFERAVKRTMVMMMMADGVVDPEEIQTIRDIYGKVTKNQLSEADVEAEIEEAKQSRTSLTEQLAQLAGSLNSEGKEMILQVAFFVAMADGEVQAEERKLLLEIGAALQMTPAHLRGVIDSLGIEG